MVETRNAFKGALVALFVRKIISVLCLMVAYMAIVIYWLSEFNLWNYEQLKNTIFWCISVGFMSLFKLEKIKKDKSFFKHSVMDNLRLLAIIQFIVGVYTFSLWVEVILVPFLAFFGTMLAIAESDEKYHHVNVFLKNCLSLFGAVLIIYTSYMLMTNFSEFGQEKTAYDFFVPPLLTLCYLPFVFFMLVYSTYELVFIRLNFAIKNKFYRCVAKLYAFVLFNVRLSLLERWSYQVARANIESHSDLVDTFKYIFKVYSSEKKPKEVPKDKGWCPYKAKNFLVSEGLNTGFYNKHINEEWFASSKMEEYGEGIIPDNIAYYVEGSEGIAKTLKIKINVNDANRTLQACKKLEKMAEMLTMSSLKQSLTEEMKDAISGCNSYSEIIGDKKISLIVERWSNHNLNGFEFKFMISIS